MLLGTRHRRPRRGNSEGNNRTQGGVQGQGNTKRITAESLPIPGVEEGILDKPGIAVAVMVAVVAAACQLLFFFSLPSRPK